MPISSAADRFYNNGAPVRLADVAAYKIQSRIFDDGFPAASLRS